MRLRARFLSVVVRLLQYLINDTEFKDVIRDFFKQGLKDVFKQELKDMFKPKLEDIFEDDSSREKIWILTNKRPSKLNWQYYRPNSIVDLLFEQATLEAVDFIKKNMSDAPSQENQLSNLTYALQHVKVDDGLYLEFGVYFGDTINHIAKSVNAGTTVHGFDSFEGLPENWASKETKGHYSTDKQLPKVSENVSLHVGWFDKTLPQFLDEHSGNVSFLHIDSDIYSSAKIVLDNLKDRIVPGTVIVFDEFFNYPDYQNHEYKAFFEFIEMTQMKYKFISYVDRGFSVALKIL